MFPPLNSTVQRGTTPGLAAHELQEKLLREARLAASPLQRRLNEAAAEGMRMLSAHDHYAAGWGIKE